MTTTSKDSTMTTPRGAWPVMLTPFHDDLSIDLEALDRYTDWLVEQGAAGLFPVALSGEMYDLTEEERLLVAGEQVHTESGAHASELSSFARFAIDRGIGALPSLEGARAELEASVRAMPGGASARLPWIKKKR